MTVRLVGDRATSLQFVFMTGLEWAAIMPNANFNLVGGLNLNYLLHHSSIPGVSNSFSAAGHIYIPGLDGPDPTEKIEAGKTVCQWSPNFLSVGTENQLINFRGTPASQISSYRWRVALF